MLSHSDRGTTAKTGYIKECRGICELKRGRLYRHLNKYHSMKYKVRTLFSKFKLVFKVRYAAIRRVSVPVSEPDRVFSSVIVLNTL